MKHKDPARILIVDDQPIGRLVLQHLLGAHYETILAENGEEALACALEEPGPDLILLDVMMPEPDGFEVCRRLKQSPRTRDIPVLFLTELDSPGDEAHGLAAGAEDFLHKPVTEPVVLARVRTHLRLSHATRALREHNHDLEAMVAARTEEIRRQARELLQRTEQLNAAQGATLTALCALLGVRDNETGNHVLRTQRFVEILARAMARQSRYRDLLDEAFIGTMTRTAPLHDIGKVAIPDRILLKPGRLNAAEREVMKQHTVYGRRALEQAERQLGVPDDAFLRCARDIAGSHHERWDGQGYPEGLAGEAIALPARIMALADVYDALVSERQYKVALSHDEACRLIRADRGAHFDPDVVDAFEQVHEEFRAISAALSDPAPSFSA